MKNIFSYIGMAIFWIVVSFGVPEMVYGIGEFLQVSFSSVLINGLQIVALILAFSNMVKIISVVLGWVEDGR